MASDYVVLQITLVPSGVRVVEEAKRMLHTESDDEVWRRAILIYKFVKPKVRVDAKNRDLIQDGSVDVTNLVAKPVTIKLSAPIYELLQLHVKESGDAVSVVLGNCMQVFIQLTRGQKLLEEQLAVSPDCELNAEDLIAILFSS